MANDNTAQQTHLPHGAAFWVPLGVVCALVIVFLAASYERVDYIINEIYETPALQTAGVLDRESVESEGFDIRARVALEQDAVLLRHSRLKAALANRTWLRFTTIVFGAILITVGAIFVLAQVATEKSDAAIAAGAFRASLTSSSPGVFLAFFGAILIAIPHFANQEVRWTDAATYVPGTLAMSAGGSQARPSGSETGRADLQEILRRHGLDTHQPQDDGDEP